jgi:NAD(P)-dependent dehydrogenase (short-subunit alcohol dehydrogenase family)
MKVVLADIDGEKLGKTLRELKDAGAWVTGVQMDVSKPAEVEALARRTLDGFGAVHVLCNNAGVGCGGRSSWETPIEGWNWVLGVNLMGVVHGIVSFMPVLLEQDTEAHVVNTASVAGIITNNFNIDYGVSKYGVVALSESLHAEMQLRGAKVRVSVLCPGPVNTDIMNSSLRLRPASVPPPPEPTAEEALFRRAYELWLERGLDPKEVGRQVLEAIREERFYVITHDFDNYVEGRIKDLLSRENPKVMEMPADYAEIVEEVARSAGNAPGD